jgi:hypothetical protein
MRLSAHGCVAARLKMLTYFGKKKRRFRSFLESPLFGMWFYNF